MNIQHLRYAIEVAKTGSITKAAENLFMGQPNLSKAIHELENSLNVHLFRRTSRGVVPTAEGEEFLHYARGIVAQVDKVESLYRSDRTSQVRFTVYAMPSLYVSEVFSRFCTSVAKEYPVAQLQLSLKEVSRSEIIEAVADGMGDVGLLRFRADEEVAMQNIFTRKALDYQPLSQYHYRVLMSTAHPLASAGEITMEMLAPYPRIALETNQLEAPYLYKSELSSPALRQGSIIVSGRDSVLMLLQRMTETYITSSPLPTSMLERYNLVLRPAAGELCRYRYMFISRHGGMNGRLETMLYNEIIALREDGVTG